MQLLFATTVQYVLIFSASDFFKSLEKNIIRVTPSCSASGVGWQVAVCVQGVGDGETGVRLEGLRGIGEVGVIAVCVLEAVRAESEDEGRLGAADGDVACAGGGGGNGDEPEAPAEVGPDHGACCALFGGAGDHHAVEALGVGVGGSVAAACTILEEKWTLTFNLVK